MEKEKVLEAIKKVKEISKKRNFVQTYDLIINLKDLDNKKPDQQIDFFAILPHKRKKPVKICAIVGPELKEEAEKYCDLVILDNQIDEYRDKKKVRKLAKEYDWFIAQSNIMTKVAAVFGRVLGPRGKMPNPKAGAVVPPKSNLKQVVDKLKRYVRITNKKTNSIMLNIGSEDMDDNVIAENILAVYDQIVHHLPKEKHNIKNVLLKLTMGPPVKII